MSIPDDVLIDWSRQADSLRPDWTCAVLREALENAERLAGLDFEIFVQGSYANGTNLRQESDVDLVIQLGLPFEEDVHALSTVEKDLFYEHFEYSVYGWEAFREDVIRSLRERYFVTPHNKCIDISDQDSLARVPADILPAIEFRWYTAFPSLADQIYEEGVFFRDAEGHAIVNFPKQHLRNGRGKDTRTGGRFKEVVRIVKNARLHESAGVRKDDAPSYFIECLWFNVPDRYYRAPLGEAYRGCLDWLGAHRDALAPLRCQNGLVDLFGKGPDQWDVKRASALIDRLDHQWCHWR